MRSLVVLAGLGLGLVLSAGGGSEGKAVTHPRPSSPLRRRRRPCR